MWTPDPGETHQAKLGEAGTGFSHPKIQNPESGIRDSIGDFGSKILDPESGKGGGGGDLEDTGPQSTVARGETGSRI